jgi:actin-like ATPase involved in cell morphogenesis
MNMSPKKNVKKLVPGAGLDVGTANIVVSRQTADGSFVNSTYRNMLFELPASDESADLLERGEYVYAKCDDKYFVIGKDALSLANALGRDEVVRPMKDGLLNPELKQSQELLFQIIKSLVGDPICDNEPIRFSVPANPVDDPEKNNIFHQMMIQSFLNSIGYDAEPLNEAMGVVYDCNPVMDVDGSKVPLTGFGISMGGGMFNVAGAYKGIPVCEFSVTKSGDYIDRQASNVTSTPVSKVTKIKEDKLDLNNVDFSDRVIAALSIYYDETIKRAITNIRKELSKTDRDFEGPCEIILAGGTSMIKGTADRFKKALAKENLTFEVLDVRMSKDPFFSVAQGMCMRARSDFDKRGK